MGQTHARKSELKFNYHQSFHPSNIRIERLRVKIENKPTLIDESSPMMLKYRTPTLRFNFILLLALLFFIIFI
jgi:hypothetical protein